MFYCAVFNLCNLFIMHVGLKSSGELVYGRYPIDQQGKRKFMIGQLQKKII
jgi:hypothetical protein